MARPRPQLRVEALEDRAVPALIGALDPSFSPNAPAGVTDIVSRHEFVDVATQSDGRLVALARTGSADYVHRYNVDGTPDRTFGTDGSVSVDFAGTGNTRESATALVVDGQNRIVVVGSTGSVLATDVAAVMLSADGKSRVTADVFHVGNATDSSTPRDVAFQTDGTVVVVGDAKVGGDRDVFVARLRGDTLGMIGAPTQIDFTKTGDNDYGYGVAVFQSGPNVNKIVVVGATDNAGASDQDATVLVLTSDGALDSSFNPSGVGRLQVDVSGSDLATGVAITAAGSILVSGSNGASDADVIAFQLLPTGAFDPAFNGGRVLTLARTGIDQAGNHGLAVDGFGRAVIAASVDGDTNVGVYRLTASGAPDGGFGPGGLQVFDVNGADRANAVLVDAAGRLVVAGKSGPSTTSGGVLLRVTASTGLPPAVAVAGGTSGNVPIFASDGSTIVSSPLYTVPTIAGTGVNTALADVNGDGALDLIVGATTGSPRVQILNGKDPSGKTVLADFTAFGGYSGGVFVAAGDINNDGRADVVVSPVSGGIGPRVAVYDGVSLSPFDTPTKLADFLGIADAVTGAADSTPGTIALVGARVAVGDATGDGIADIVVAAGSNGGPRVTIWDGKNVAAAPNAGTPSQPPLANAFVFEDTQRDGAFVALGDVTGDGKADLIAGGGPNSGARVRVGDMAPILAARNFGAFDTQLGVVKSNFIVNESDSRGGIRVAARDIDGDGIADLVTGSGAGLPSQINVFKGTRLATITSGIQKGDYSFDPFGAVLPDGVYVG